MDVYVCYARADLAVAKQFKEELEGFLSPVTVCLSPKCDEAEMERARLVVALVTGKSSFSSVASEEGREYKLASDYNKRILFVKWKSSLRNIFLPDADAFSWYEQESKEHFLRVAITFLGRPMPVYNALGLTVPFRINAHFVEPFSLLINGREVLSGCSPGKELIFPVVFLPGTYEIVCRSDKDDRYSVTRTVVVTSETKGVEIDLNTLADRLGYPYEQVDYRGYRRGVMRNGLLTGVVQENTPACTCQGDIVNGRLIGKVRMHWTNGAQYVGEWVDGKLTGQGEYTWPDGSRYKGGFLDGKMSGKGKVNWPDGSSYEGDWLDGRRHGYGRLVWPNGAIYEGEWKQDKRTGLGRYTWPDGTAFQGLFFEGKTVGDGTYTFPDGTHKVGPFEDQLKKG